MKDRVGAVDSAAKRLEIAKIAVDKGNAKRGERRPVRLRTRKTDDALAGLDQFKRKPPANESGPSGYEISFLHATPLLNKISAYGAVIGESDFPIRPY